MAHNIAQVSRDGKPGALRYGMAILLGRPFVAGGRQANIKRRSRTDQRVATAIIMLLGKGSRRRAPDHEREPAPWRALDSEPGDHPQQKAAPLQIPYRYRACSFSSALDPGESFANGS